MSRASTPDPGDGVSLLRLSERQRSWQSKRYCSKYVLVLVALFITLMLLSSTNLGSRVPLPKSASRPQGVDLHSSGNISTIASHVRTRKSLAHVLIPASNPSPDLCKLLATATALGYPQPQLLAWNQTFEKDHMMAGGSHIAKIGSTREGLSQIGRDKDDELVLMMDGYDIWFQLPPDVMAARYYDIVEQTDARLAGKLGPEALTRVHEAGLGDLLSNKIIFAAGKRCAPNQLHTMACYALPDSPLPGDLYGKNTDTATGHNKYYSYRQRFLNSGYIVGPVGAMRRLFEHAEEWVDDHEASWAAKNDFKEGVDPLDDGTNGSDFFYHGSDQSIFAKIFGRQEYVREELRRRWDPTAGGPGDRFKGKIILQEKVVDDILSPKWPHEDWNEDHPINAYADPMTRADHLDLRNSSATDMLERYDYGITLDYFSDLGHQTVNSERDARWLVHADKPLASLIKADDRSPLDCPVHISKSRDIGSFPPDIENSSHPNQIMSNADGNVASTVPSPWLSTSLYTHLCLSNNDHAKIPVMIHHNGDKSRRASTWHEMSWLSGIAKDLLTERPESGKKAESWQDSILRGSSVGRAPGWNQVLTDQGYAVSWDDLCPNKMLKDAKVSDLAG